MTKGLKIFIIICAGFVALGVVLAGIGFLLGGSGNLPVNKLPFHFFGFDRNSSLSGVVIQDAQELEAFTGVDIDMSMSNIKFIPGDAYRVEYAYDEKYGKPSIQVTDGILSIWDRSAYDDIHLGLSSLKGLNNYPDKLYVYVYFPAGSEFSAIDINNDLGSLTMKDMVTDSLTATLDLGECQLTNVTAGWADLSLDLGDLSCKNFQTNGLSVSANMGSINLQGAFYGKSEIDCDLGDVRVTTSVPKEDYGYDIKIDLGDFTLDGQKMGSPYVSNSSGANQLEIDANLGDINILFD